MASTGTRLRKTFKYPSDSESSDASRDELDEEGQHLLPSLELSFWNNVLDPNHSTLIVHRELLSAVLFLHSGQTSELCNDLLSEIARRRSAKKYPLSSECWGTALLFLSLPVIFSACTLTEYLPAPEQEGLVTSFQEKNAHQNAIYTVIFTLLPLLLTLPFILRFSASPLLSTLGITSLCISAGRTRVSFSSQPIPPRKSSQTDGLLRWLQLTDFEHRLLDAVPEGGPLRMALPWLNVAICAVLALAAALLYWRGRDDGGGGQGNGMWVLYLLPAIAQAMVEVALRSMRDVEKGVGELERLKYRYKGA